MANGGWYGTAEEWRLAEEPLPELDAIISKFASDNRFSLSKNTKDWPSRALQKAMPLKSMLQIFRVALGVDAWKVWAVCSEDRGDKRYWRQENIADGITAADLKTSISNLLAVGLERLEEWNASPEKLEFATMLGRFP